MSSTCERCGEAHVAAELELDVAGKFCCRRCRARIAVIRADQSLTERGIVRACGRCGQPAMRPEVETYTVPTGATSDGQSRSTFGYCYRCASCSARAWFFRPAVLAFFVGFALAVLPIALIVEPTRPFGWSQRSQLGFVFSWGDVAWWLRCVLVLMIPVVLLGYDQWQRYRNPPV